MVVRYYGGVLLGTGGLVKACSGGVGAALEAAQARIKRRKQTLPSSRCDYGDVGAVEALISATRVGCWPPTMVNQRHSSGGLGCGRLGPGGSGNDMDRTHGRVYRFLSRWLNPSLF